MAQLSDTIVWSKVQGAADYRVRAVTVQGAAVGTVQFTTDRQIEVSEVLAGVPLNESYVVYVAPKDVAGPGQGTPGAEVSVGPFLLESLPAPATVKIV